MSTEFHLDQFKEFCGALSIDTKELGRVKLGDHFMGTQSWVMDGIDKGLQDGIRNFVILKCRQAGISTLVMALDLYWVFRHEGMSGALVLHDDDSRAQFKETLQLYYDGLPHEWRREVNKHNRSMFSFDNRSRLMYKVAGTTKKKSSGALGRSSALAFLHATEMSSWADDEGLASLRSSLAEHNPNRLYLWESTARGFNLFYDMWEEAKRSVTQRAIFVSFWANEFYRAKRGGETWKAFWGKSGKPTQAERGWIRDVKSLYGVTIDDEQVAWYRWMVMEKGGDEMMMMQEHPPTEHHAFIATGSQFFSALSISNNLKRLKRAEEPDYYRIEIKDEFYQTEVRPVVPRMSTLKIWDMPAKGRAQYVLGCDPKYGSEATHDTNSISVWRCYGDACIQVAQWGDPDMPTYAVAWVMCFLAGFYSPCMVNLEINGPGQAVFDEMNKLKKRAAYAMSDGDRKLWNVVRNIQNYFYMRADSMSGSPQALHTQTTYQSKDRYMNNFRDYFERGICVPQSLELVNEMKGIVRENGAAPAAGGRSTDDHVSSAALAVHAWTSQLMTRLMASGISLAQSVQAEKNAGAIEHVGAGMVNSYLKLIGVGPR